MRINAYYFIVIVTLLFISVVQVFAQTSTTVKASVGKYYFSVSGYVSPFASIVMRSNSIFMASTVADPKGNFSIEKVLVNEGFTDFCLEAVDAKRIGDTFTCFKVSPVTSDLEKTNIFLPPTIGLSGKKITPGSSVFASGYTMPNAKVLLNISEDIIIEADANESGFYRVEIKDLPVGKYSLFASARYQNRDSEKPGKKLELESLSLVQIFMQNPLLILVMVLVLSIIILIIILLSKRLRYKMKGLFGKVSSKNKNKPATLHHGWFLGY